MQAYFSYSRESKDGQVFIELKPAETIKQNTPKLHDSIWKIISSYRLHVYVESETGKIFIKIEFELWQTYCEDSPCILLDAITDINNLLK